MNKEETLALYAKGKDAWNAWAEDDVEAEKAELKVKGEWEVEQSNRSSGRNKRTRDWMSRATADFSQQEYEREMDFCEFYFPWIADFSDETFLDNALFMSARFVGEVRFSRAVFSGYAEFFLSTFSRNVILSVAKFSGLASFSEVKFSLAADFHSAKFSAPALFREAVFSDKAQFGEVTFFDSACFADAKFRGPVVFFGCQFGKSADFQRAVFCHGASFNAIRAESAFSLANAEFAEVPDFIQAHFAEAPRLDNVKMPSETVWKKLCICGAGERNSSLSLERMARWRALKRMAAQAHDIERELEYFSKEMKCARIALDKPLPLAFWKRDFWTLDEWARCLRFWFGFFYQILSDFGRSVARPLLFWFLLAAASAVCFVAERPGGVLWASQPCTRGVGADISGLTRSEAGQTNAWREAASLALRNGLVFLSAESAEARRIYGCLYGLQGGTQPIVPTGVSLTTALQKLGSLILIFLLGLGVRNMLRMK